MYLECPFDCRIKQDSCATSTRHARLQICTSFLRIARASDKSILPHMKVTLLLLFAFLVIALIRTVLAQGHLSSSTSYNGAFLTVKLVFNVYK